MEAAKVLLATGGTSAACVADMNVKAVAQFALGLYPAKMVVLNSSNVLMWFVYRPESLPHYQVSVFFLATGTNPTTALNAAQGLITTHEDLGRYLADVLILSTSNFCLHFSKQIP